MILCENVTKIYDSETDMPSTALNGVSYQFPTSGLVGITGPSGSGKSTLLHCLSSLLVPTTGRILFRGQNMLELSADSKGAVRRKEFGLIFQKDFLIQYLDCISNILVRENSYIQAQTAENLLEEVGLTAAKYAHKYPGELSGGQRQRVAIARGLIGAPSVIFADEPTASLDKESACKVMKLFQKQAEQALILIVTHDMDIMAQCTVQISMKAGEIVS